MKLHTFHRFVPYLMLAAVFVAITNMAHINYAVRATSEYRYTGANPYTAADKLVYFSMIEQGRDGRIFMKNLHTTEPQRGLIFSPHWWLIGQTARLFNVSNNASYQLYRVSFTIAFIILLYALLRRLFEKNRDRIIASLFVFFSGGLGWLYVTRYPGIVSEESPLLRLLNTPTDLYVTEGVTLLNFSQSPLFSLAQALLLFIFYWFVKNSSRHSVRHDFLCSILLLLLTTLHPYDAPIALVVLGSWTVWRTYRSRDFFIIKKFTILAFGAIVGLAYNYYIVTVDPILSQWLSQNLVYSPRFSMYVWGYGLMIPLWAIGAFVVVRERRDNPWWMLLLIWTSVTWLLLYTPISVNRRFVNGLHIALALISYLGFRFCYDQCRRRWLKVAYSLAVLIPLFSHVIFYAFVNLYFDKQVYTYGYYYVTSAEDDVIRYLKSSTTAEDKLLTSDMKTSFTVASQLVRAVYRGHDHQTPRSHLAEQNLTWFFSDSESPVVLARKHEFLRRNDLSYVIVNTTRLAGAPTWLGRAHFLSKVFSSGPIAVYRVAL